MAFRKEPAKKAEASPVPAAPAAPVLKRLRCTEDSRYQGVHYQRGDAVRVDDKKAEAMLATGRFAAAK